METGTKVLKGEGKNDKVGTQVLKGGGKCDEIGTQASGIRQSRVS